MIFALLYRYQLTVAWVAYVTYLVVVAHLTEVAR